MRQEQLIQAATNLIDLWKEWQNSSYDELTVSFEEAVEDTLAVFRTGDIPERCRDLTAGVSKLDAEWQQYKLTVSKSNPMPRNSFWGAMELVEHYLKGATRGPDPTIEPVWLLFDQKVSPRQIAFEIYGYRGQGPFITNGQIDLAKLYQEKNQPGSIIPQGWVHPEKAARIAEQQMLDARMLASYEERKERAAPIAPESIETLLLQKVYPQQIAKMKGCTLADVIAEAERLGISPTEKPDLKSAMVTQEPEHVVIDEPEEEPEGEPMQSIEDTIREYHAQGFSAMDIAKAVGVSLTEVSKVVKELAPEPVNVE